jgi:hypothetical protein
MAREPALSREDADSLREVIAWVRKARDPGEMRERTLGMKAFVELHPRLRAAAESFRPSGPS